MQDYKISEFDKLFLLPIEVGVRCHIYSPSEHYLSSSEEEEVWSMSCHFMVSRRAFKVLTVRVVDLKRVTGEVVALRG